MEYTTIHYEKRDRVGHISFNRPEIHNAFNSTVINEMADVFGVIAADDDLRVILLTGKGK